MTITEPSLEEEVRHQSAMSYPDEGELDRLCSESLYGTGRSDAINANAAKALRLPTIERAAYGTGHILNDMTGSVWFSYLLVFFRKVLLFSNLRSGILISVGQAVDAVFNPIVGTLSDRTSLSFGRRKSWILGGSIAIVATFPFFAGGCKTCEEYILKRTDIDIMVYYLGLISIFQIGWASVQVSHLSLVTDLTRCQDERTVLYSLRFAATIFANVSVFVATWLLFRKSDSSDLGPADIDEFQALNFGVVGAGFLFVVFCLVFVREPPAPRNTTSGGLITWRDWLAMKEFYQVGVLYMCSRFIQNVAQFYLPMYLLDTLGLSKTAIATVPLTLYVSSMLTTFGMRPLNRHLGRKTAYTIGIGLVLFACVAMYIMPRESEGLMFGASVLLGVGTTTIVITAMAMEADFVAGNVESGAFVYGSMSFMEKMANGLAILIVQAIDPCGEQCAPGQEDFYRHIVSFVPAGGCVIAILMILYYDHNPEYYARRTKKISSVRRRESIAQQTESQRLLHAVGDE